MDCGSSHSRTSFLFISDDVETGVSMANRRRTSSGFGHFLDLCFNCKKQLGRNRDVFMYRGDVPFCSEDCRREKIVADEAAEKQWKTSSSQMKNWVSMPSASSNKKNEQHPGIPLGAAAGTAVAV